MTSNNNPGYSVHGGIGAAVVRTVVLALLATAGSDAFVTQSASGSAAATKQTTELNALWRNWVPQSADFLDVAMGERPNSNSNSISNANAKNHLAESTGDDRTQTKAAAVAAAEHQHGSFSDTTRWQSLWATAAAILLATAGLPLGASAVSGGGLDFAGLDISNQDFSNQNFKGKDFTQVLARNTNFAGSNFAGCRFPKAYLINANYEGADLRGVSFEGTNMESVNLKNAIAAGAYFGATIIDAGNVENADFTDAQFPPKTLALMCERPDMKGTNPTTGADTRDSAMCP
eukprot:CAMPEP_0172357694 /NCGR_PEP_ID=MMETSP1060-20121228/2053_1 /TAXON_ID=37318 /ORGANISM="Pseudo-nitzschia pungens, Strain cf. cingulata" /LENGTH=288 /DNA_ID=CAMNT_0013078501 /DNA_START=219 /DNA_END=1085 /DNA_ORIENTATION=+